MTTEGPHYGIEALEHNTAIRWRIWVSARRAQGFTRWAIITAVFVTLFVYFL